MKQGEPTVKEPLTALDNDAKDLAVFASEDTMAQPEAAIEPAREVAVEDTGLSIAPAQPDAIESAKAHKEGENHIMIAAELTAKAISIAIAKEQDAQRIPEVIAAIKLEPTLMYSQTRVEVEATDAKPTAAKSNELAVLLEHIEAVCDEVASDVIGSPASAKAIAADCEASPQSEAVDASNGQLAEQSVGVAKPQNDVCVALARCFSH